MKPVIIEQAPDSFYTYIVREVNNGRGGVETVCIRGYDARTFKTRAAAEKSTAKYIAKVGAKNV